MWRQVSLSLSYRRLLTLLITSILQAAKNEDVIERMLCNVVCNMHL